jgi:hypothetical protein
MWEDKCYAGEVLEGESSNMLQGISRNLLKETEERYCKPYLRELAAQRVFKPDTSRTQI